MAFRGWFFLDGQELANSSRVIEHLRPSDPVIGGVELEEHPGGSGLFIPFDTVEDPPGSGLFTVPARWTEDPEGLWERIEPVSNSFAGCSFTVPYDDSWSELRSFVGYSPFQITNAPWYSPDLPASAEFAGVWVMDVQGLDAPVIQREVGEAICPGGVAGPSRISSRPVTFSALIVANTNAGATFGLSWLNTLLARASSRSGVEMTFLLAHPDDTAVPAADLVRNLRSVVLTETATVTSVAGLGGGQRHRQSSVWRADWKMVALDPYVWGNEDGYPVVWGSVVEDPIEWVHAPNCTDPDSCTSALPVLFSTECAPPQVAITATPPPSCSGCVPVCGIDRHVYSLPTAALAGYPASAVTVEVTNQGGTPLSVSLYWRVCGATAECDRQFPLQVSGLPVDATVVADSVTARPYAMKDGTRHRQVGIVTTPSGAPWEPVLLTPGTCWELVAEAAPDALFTVKLTVRGRQL